VYVCGVGAVRSKDRVGELLEERELERLLLHLPAGLLHLLDDVVDRLVVAGRAGDAGAVVVVGDLCSAKECCSMFGTVTALRQRC
jgi:hypothetical protein